MRVRPCFPQAVALGRAQVGQYIVDCASQGPGPPWSLHQWRLYWRARLRAEQAPEEILASGSARLASRGTATPLGALPEN
jgi:hypothetical protein